MLILIDEARGLAVNPEGISSMCRCELRVRNARAGDKGDTLYALTIQMMTGEQLTVDGSPSEVVALHQRLLDACN
ncbi:hypothetical protein HU720_05315 [Pseudomonas sp. SWRI51]|uniref:hypothetical protein n=1 Tax=Pseudomonas sp. SWRI51 TaxID=2745491 RepID=UPI0016485EEC|nr:hypothetical protein [Pseudomonas sp. SWRI51]MBC3410716.1 hypothetical protein [Pseudomonas sp. SWRI51]